MTVEQLQKALSALAPHATQQVVYIGMVASSAQMKWAYSGDIEEPEPGPKYVHPIYDVQVQQVQGGWSLIILPKNERIAIHG